MAQLTVILVLLVATMGGLVLGGAPKNQARLFYQPANKSKTRALATIPVGKVPLVRIKTGPREYTYTLGTRVTGDQVVFHAQDARDFDQLVHATLTVNYSGLTVSYVKIRIIQSTEDGFGEAWVDTGAINSNQISLISKTYYTKTFIYSVDVYGK